MSHAKFAKYILRNPQVSQYLCPKKHQNTIESEPLVERIIYLEGFQSESLHSSSDLGIDASFLPNGTQEVLWVHPINLDFSEVLSRVKTKESYEKRMLFSCEG